MTSNGDIDLTDAATVEALKEGNVLEAKPDKETVAAEKAIRNAKSATVTLKFNHAENSQLTRMAAVKGMSVKDFLLRQIHELLLDSNVAKPLISSPSFAGNGKRISGPSKDFGRNI